MTSYFVAAVIATVAVAQEANSCFLGTQTGCDTSVALGLTK